MIVALVGNLLISLILIYYSFRNESIRWFIAGQLLGSCGMLGDIIEGSVLMGWQTQGAGVQHLHMLLEQVSRGLHFLTNFAIYALLMMAIAYSRYAKRSHKYMLAFLLPLPIAVFYPLTAETPLYNIYDFILLAFLTAYMLAAAYLLIHSAAKERNPHKRKERVIIALLLVPTTFTGTAIGAYGTIKQALSGQFQYNTNSVATLCAATAFLIFFFFVMFRHNVFGLKIVLKKQYVDQMVKGIAYGTIMMNHALKNHAVNIQMVARRHKLRGAAAHDGEDMDVIISESEQLMEVIKRIRSQIEDIEIDPEPCDVTELLENALKSNRQIIEEQSIAVEKRWQWPCSVWCDKVHIQEVFHNMIRNGVEACKNKPGVLQLYVDAKRSKLKVSVTDNGAGIEKMNLDQIFDPFFSTKSGANNYGLGLSYCYIVLQKHKGDIEVASREGEGTTFTVTMPRKRA